MTADEMVTAVRDYANLSSSAEDAQGAQILRALNREHRGKDEVTDVLSFPIDGLEELPSGMDRQLGDVVIAPAQAARQATGGTGSELRTLLVHGLLHLLEYDHETDDDVMLARQDALCEALPALSDPG